MISEATSAWLVAMYNNGTTTGQTVWSPLTGRALTDESVTLTPAILLSGRLHKEPKEDA